MRRLACTWLLALLSAVPARALADTASVPVPEREVLVQASAGLGVGAYQFSRPTELGEQRLPNVFFPAAGVALRAEGWPYARFSLKGLLRYQTSLGLRVKEHPLFALPNELSARVANTELSLAPAFRLQDKRIYGTQLSFPVGMRLQSFWPDIRELTIPGYSLLGPFLRAELLESRDWFAMRGGLQAQAILVLDEHMKAAGLQGHGFAYGAEIALMVGPHYGTFSLELCYHFSFANVANRLSGPDYEDWQQFLILSLQGAL